jgi:ankyrin repeat protein
LLEHKCYDDHAIAEAALNGHFRIVKLLVELSPYNNLNFALSQSYAADRKEIIKYLEKLGAKR